MIDGEVGYRTPAQMAQPSMPRMQQAAGPSGVEEGERRPPQWPDRVVRRRLRWVWARRTTGASSRPASGSANEGQQARATAGPRATTQRDHPDVVGDHHAPA